MFWRVKWERSREIRNAGDPSLRQKGGSAQDDAIEGKCVGVLLRLRPAW